MATNTYVALDKVTVGTATSSVTFSSISSAYTDLVVIGANLVAATGNPNVDIRFNGDTGSNYSCTILEGNGTSATSTRKTNRSAGIVDGDAVSLGGTNPSTIIWNIMNYSNATTYKTVLVRGNELSTTYPGVTAAVGLWRNTNAITSLDIILGGGGSNFAVGSTFSLYGIKSEAAAAKATGGYITSDATYFYHTFPASGTFTPTQSITADMLVIAGGGGGSSDDGGGGGAGGLLAYSSQSLTATGYTCTVGAGGAGGNGTQASQGANSQFGALTASVGGGYGSTTVSPAGTGGSGGGGGRGGGSVGGSATSGQGNAGGNGINNSGTGGGGGAGAAGTSATSAVGAAGGVGLSTYSSWGLATGTGENVSGTYYFAGGGGGGSNNTGTYPSGGYGGGGAGGPYTNPGNGTAGTVNTGGGGGGGSGGYGVSTNGAAGGSGIVIVRYLKA
jgi:hypothetical protein